MIEQKNSEMEVWKKMEQSPLHVLHRHFKFCFVESREICELGKPMKWILGLNWLFHKPNVNAWITFALTLVPSSIVPYQLCGMMLIKLVRNPLKLNWGCDITRTIRIQFYMNNQMTWQFWSVVLVDLNWVRGLP